MKARVIVTLKPGVLDPQGKAIEGALQWSIQKSRRSGGDRAGGFPGATTILAQLDNGSANDEIDGDTAARFKEFVLQRLLQLSLECCDVRFLLGAQ